MVELRTHIIRQREYDSEYNRVDDHQQNAICFRISRRHEYCHYNKSAIIVLDETGYFAIGDAAV